LGISLARMLYALRRTIGSFRIQIDGKGNCVRPGACMLFVELQVELILEFLEEKTSLVQ
jgi:hypothetical protein